MHWISIEPMLERINLKPFLYDLDWVIVGAESGSKRRPFDLVWAWRAWWQCHDAGVPFFGKQDSGLRPGVPLFIEGHEIKEFPKEVAP